MTVSERPRVGPAAASSAMTPPYECPTRWSPARAARDERGVPLEVDPIDGRVRAGIRAGRRRRARSARPAVAAAPRRRAADDAPVDEDEPLHRAPSYPCNELRRFPLDESQIAVTSAVVCSARDDAGRGPLASLARHRLGAPAGHARPLRWRSARSSAGRSARGGSGSSSAPSSGSRSARSSSTRSTAERDVSAGIFSTPRPLPSRIGPTIAGGTIIALALPIFAIAGWPLEAGRSPPSSGSPPRSSRCTGAPPEQPR